MERAMLFCWECIKDAFSGSIALANAWAGIFGVAVVAIAAHLYGYQLKLPENLQEYFAFGFLTLATAWVCIFLLRLVTAPCRLYWREYDARARAEARLANATIPDADWPIHELFSHIQPDLLDRPDEQIWERVGNDIRDKLSLGQLKIWGRPVENGVGKILGERPALRAIDPAYWHHAHFTYAFFDETAGDAAHTYVEGDADWAYTDLRVNRIEATGIWH